MRVVSGMTTNGSVHPFTIRQHGPTVSVGTNDAFLVLVTFSIIVGHNCMESKVEQGYRIIPLSPIFKTNILRVFQRSPNIFSNVL